MNPGSKSRSSSRDQAFPFLALDIIREALSSADKPDELGQGITRSLRQLTGARTIILLQDLHAEALEDHKVVAVFPERHKKLIESAEMTPLLDLTHGMKRPTLWLKKDLGGEAGTILGSLELGQSIAAPLLVGPVRVGCLLLLDIPEDEHGIHQVLETLELLSTTIALVFRNSLLYEQQEATIRENRMLLDAIQKELAERKRVEEELRKHREHLEELIKVRTSELEARTADLEQANIHLQEADRIKSIFLASMSHELRTPLNSIIGFTSIILMGMVGEVTKEQSRQLTIVKKNANHLLELINDLLDVSKIEAGRVELSLEEFEIADIVGEVIEAFSPAIKEKGLELLMNVPEGIMLYSDERRIKQVIMNLVSNAVKFTAQGSVKIAARVLEEEKLELSVIDTGIGIKKEESSKLFAPFQQIEDSLAKRYEGTGLGLYLTKKLVDLLGGEIRAKSEYGRGSEFTFVLALK